MIIGLFEAIKNIGQTLANNLIKLFDQWEKSLHMSKMRGQTWMLNNYLEIYCEMWNPGS
jgi:hypothetical protein